MGENVLRGQVKAFEKGRDRSLQRMAAPTLFDRPDVITTNYTAEPVNGSRIKQGDVLDGYVSADGQRVNLADGHRIVGTINGDGAKSLLGAMSEAQNLGFTAMKVTEVSGISGYFKTTVDGANEDQ
jgi:hypothetical protein